MAAPNRTVRGPGHGPGHGPGARGPRPHVENPGKIRKRLLGVVLKNYTPHCILVLICIVGNAWPPSGARCS